MCKRKPTTTLVSQTAASVCIESWHRENWKPHRASTLVRSSIGPFLGLPLSLVSGLCRSPGNGAVTCHLVARRHSGYLSLHCITGDATLVLILKLGNQIGPDAAGARVEDRHQRWYSLLALRPCHVYTLRHIPPGLTCSGSRHCFLDQEICFYFPSTPSRASAAAGSPCPAWVARARSVGPTLSMSHTATPPVLSPRSPRSLPGCRRLVVYGGRLAGHMNGTGTSPAGGAAPATAATFSCGHRPCHLPFAWILFGFFTAGFLHSPPAVLR